MQSPLELNKEEQLRLMRALYSVFYRDKDINSVEKSVLDSLNRCFGISTSEYRHYVHVNVADIAKEINAIQDVRVRVYFMRIIHDTYHKEAQSIWGETQDLIEEVQGIFSARTQSREKVFKAMYGYLQTSVNFES